MFGMSSIDDKISFDFMLHSIMIPVSEIQLYIWKVIAMIYEHRTYRVTPGTLPEFMKLYDEHVFPVISRYAKLITAGTTESGALNSVVFIWAYDGFGERTEQRAKLAADPEWGPAVGKIVHFLVHQDSFFMNPATFSPDK
jgi:hypothetical protein